MWICKIASGSQGGILGTMLSWGIAQFKLGCAYKVVRRKYRELAAAWSKRLGGHQQVCAAIFLSSVVKHLWENLGLPHLLHRYSGTIESVSLAVFSAFYLWPIHLYALHRKVKVIPAPTPAYWQSRSSNSILKLVASCPFTILESSSLHVCSHVKTKALRTGVQ